MKRNLIVTIIFLSLILSNCSKEQVTSPPVGGNSGGLLFKIDRQNTPDNVAIVTAKLTRTGYTPIIRTLNILTDTTADLTISSVAVGTWNLKVEAFTSTNVLIYSGEATVTVQDGITTQVSLTLQPVQTGVGNIYIYVTWGGTQTNWSDHPNNPILSPAPNASWEIYGVQQPIILFENNQYKMWYLGLASGSHSSVGYATSVDGINWQRPYNYPVLSPGNTGAWDAMATAAGAIIHESSGYKMYYVGWSNQNSNWHIGLATSADGVTWTKHSSPVIQATSGWEYQLIPSSILKINGVYYLYYYGRNNLEYKIGLATSTDGVVWTKYSGNPILLPTETWEGTGVHAGSVISENGIFKMVYMNSYGNAFGMATSIDGKNWTKSNTNPFFKSAQTSNAWGSSSIAYPNFIKTANEYRVYYSGYSNSSIYKIGFVKKNY